MNLTKLYIIQSITAASNNLRLSTQKIEVVALLREFLGKSENLDEDIRRMKKITELSTLAIRLNEVYTFLSRGNVDFFKRQTGANGLMKKMAIAVNNETVSEACVAMFKALSDNSRKAEMALNLLYTSDPSELTPPLYIAEGLAWLEDILVGQKADYFTPVSAEKGGDDEK